jgi:serine/threonine protein kinase
MSKSVAPPRERWEPLVDRGRSFHRFMVHIGRGAAVPFTVARQIAHRYEPREVFARGGGGLVFLARDGRTGHDVLVKALADYVAEPLNATDPSAEFLDELRHARHHLQTERRILVQLRRLGSNAVPHPNDYVFDSNPGLRGPHPTESGTVWAFDDDALIDSEPYLVMQRVHGTSLQWLLADRYPRGMDERSALAIIDQVACVIELLHRPIAMRNGQLWRLVYQDVKPDNILVDEYGRATLLDFGGCQVVIDDILVLHGSSSRGYRAPECDLEDVLLTPATDCYSLGATLFHMLSGVNPLELCSGEPNRGGPRSVPIDSRIVASQCPRRMHDLLKKSLAPNPRARFQTIQELRGALAELL